MKEYHTVSAISFTATTMSVHIDGVERVFDLAALSEKLAKASEQERREFEISPAGYGIHWPRIDEDLSVDGLLGVVHVPATQRKTA